MVYTHHYKAKLFLTEEIPYGLLCGIPCCSSILEVLFSLITLLWKNSLTTLSIYVSYSENLNSSESTKMGLAILLFLIKKELEQR